MNAETATIEKKLHAASEKQPLDKAASEVTNFLTGFAVDSKKREKFAIDKEAFLKESDLSEDAKEILRAPNANLLLRKLNETTAAILAVIVLETVTTEVVVL